jgi:DNA-binding LytR/AlgR family response regulator
MTINCIIVEDEPHSLNRLKHLLEDFDYIKIVGEAEDGETAVKEINSKKPDLVFLDINIPGKNGFEVLQKIKYDPMVIFVTAYEKYALKAFEENAVDYILKPTDKKRLEKSLNRVIDKKQKLDSNMLDMIKGLVKKEEYMTRFSIKGHSEITIILEEDVYYFKAQEKYTFLCTYDEEHFYDSSLKKLEKSLNPEKFLRIHKSYIVAMDKVAKIQKQFLRDYIVELNDKAGTILKVGRSYIQDFKSKFDL